MLKLLHTQITQSTFNMDHTLNHNSMVAHTTTGSLHTFQPTTLILRSLMLEPRLLQQLRLKLHQQVINLRPSDGTNQLGINQDHQPHSETLLKIDLILDQAETGSLHMFQLTTHTQRSMTLEPRLLQLLKLKLHQLVMLQRLSDGTSQLGINQALPSLSETLFNLILKILLVLASRELLTSKCHQPPTLAQMPTKQPLMTRTAQLMETPPGTPSLPQEPPSQRMLWPLHTQDIPSTDLDCVR